MNPFDLSGKTAIVTGSTKGIGRSIAEHLARAGARVAISSRKAEACQSVAEAIRGAGGEAAAIPANAGKKEELANLVDQTRKELGPVDIVVCNAAANPYFGPLTDISDDAYHKTMDTNVLSIIWLCSMVKPDMIARGGGSVIVIASTGGMRASPNLGAYGISKAAAMQVTRSLAAELGPDQITVNCIAPGLIKTDFSRLLWDNPRAEELAKQGFPMQRLGVSDDVGPAAVYFSAPASSWVTGQVLIIDGGSTISQPARLK